MALPNIPSLQGLSTGSYTQPIPSPLAPKSPMDMGMPDDSVALPKPGSVSKLSIATAQYLGPADGPFECDNCKHFQDPRACEIVDGDIDPKGCCSVFEKGSGESDGGGVNLGNNARQ